MSDFFELQILPHLKDIAFAAAVLVIGIIFIRILNRILPKSALFKKIEPSVASFILSTIKILLCIFLIIIIISILGVPTTSIVAAMTSAFLAIGLALQGALSNFAGGIMIILFNPYKIGDYITCSGGTGTVKEISVIYTSLITDDNNRITIPNGTLMNDAVINHTVEGTRRVDINFSVAYGTDEQILEKKLIDIAVSDDRILFTPAPVLKTVQYLDNGVRYSLRFWCESDLYWDVYYSIMDKVNHTLCENNISAPTSKVRIDTES